jgi:hypothetical protein
MKGSMSRKGDGWDIAVTETLFGSLTLRFSCVLAQVAKVVHKFSIVQVQKFSYGFFPCRGVRSLSGRGKEPLFAGAEILRDS